MSTQKRHTATFLLTTGRSGTQWITHALSKVMGAGARVEHEPLGFDYHSRQLLGASDLQSVPTAARIEAHIASIKRTLETQDYIETGWPSYGALPHIARRLGSHMRVVHLTRHPVATAWSLVTHHFYQQPPRKDGLEHYALLTPFDPGARLADLYRSAWSTMTPFERCLYFWTEIHSLGLEWGAKTAVPWLRVTFEDIFLGDGLRDFSSFLGIDETTVMEMHRNKRADKYQFKSPIDVDPDLIRHHPQTIEVAKALGYDPMDWDMDALRLRYKGKSVYT